MGRYSEAQEQLSKAIKRDWYDAVAHVELGVVFLYLGEARYADATREFRQALAIDPACAPAAIGLANALERSSDDGEAEAALRDVLQRQERNERWRVHLALARLLMQRGDKQQSLELYAEAYAQAQKAIELAPDNEGDPHFVAGVAKHRIGSAAGDVRGRLQYRHQAMEHLRQCLRRDKGNAQAERNLHILERELSATVPAVVSGYAVGMISLVLLGTMWVAFFIGNKVTTTVLTVMTPVFVGLFTIAMLLPSLIHLKLPGFEAELDAGVGAVSQGPTGEITFASSQFTVSTGPTGQFPKRQR
jgi:tetratricopeptide (TPR) repeat protein